MGRRDRAGGAGARRSSCPRSGSSSRRSSSTSSGSGSCCRSCRSGPRRFGASPTQIGLLTASYAVMQLLFAPVWGRLSDRYGRRPDHPGLARRQRRVGAADRGGRDAAACCSSPASSRGSPGASYAAAQAYVADVTTRSERARGMGMIGAAFGLGFMLGPAFGAVFSAVDQRLPFFVAAGAGGAELAHRLPPSARVAAPRRRRARRPRGSAAAARARRAASWGRWCGSRSSPPSPSSAWSPRSRSSASAASTTTPWRWGSCSPTSACWPRSRRGCWWGGWSRAGARSRVMIAGLVGTAGGAARGGGRRRPVGAAGRAGAAGGGLRAGVRHHHGPDLPGGARAREQGAVLGLTASVGERGAHRRARRSATLLFQHAGVAVPLMLGAALFALCAARAPPGRTPGRRHAAAPGSA